MRRVTNSQLTIKNQIGVFNMSHCIQEADKGIVAVDSLDNRISCGVSIRSHYHLQKLPDHAEGDSVSQGEGPHATDF